MPKLLRRRRSRRVRPLVVGAAAAVASLALTAPSAVAQADGGDLAVDEISHSKNVKPVTNIPRTGQLANATHSDLAFKGDYAFQGTYDGFTIYDISKKKPRIVSQVYCPGGQGDVTVSEKADLLYMSVDYARSDATCESEQGDYEDPTSWEGIRVFDISNLASPEYVGAVKTKCGSHTHTLVPAKSGNTEYLYVSSYSPSDAFPNCQPPHDSISVVEVPLSSPGDAAVVNEPVLFPEGGGARTSGCHDITVLPDADLAGGACMGDGVLLDITDRVNPEVITTVRDPNFAFYHSATFSNDFSQVIFTDELGGGGAPTCNEEVGPQRGANAIFDITGSGANRELEFRSYYKIPRHQQDTENCVAHNGSLVPVPGDRNVMVQSWYQGGVSLYEFTDASNPAEIGYFERGPLSDENLTVAGSWSAYYYNGYVYSSDMAKGLDVLRLKGPGMKEASRVEMEIFNPQTQYAY